MIAKTFLHQHRVTYAECTVGNHIYYANYLSLLEEARGEFFRSLGLSFLTLQNDNTVFPVLECSLKYKAPARYDDLLTLAVWVIELKGVRLGFSYQITSESGQLVLEAQTRHACTSIHDKPHRLPEAVIQKLAPYLVASAPAE